MLSLSLPHLPGRRQNIAFIKGAHVIDPKNSIDVLMDIAVTDNRIVAVAKYIDLKMGIQGANPIVRPVQLSDYR